MEQSENNEETKKCSNCDKQIPISKYRIHDTQCSRINFKCRCGEVVLKSEKEDHEREFHTIKKCSNCDFEAEAVAYGDHDHYCLSKPVVCDFCE